MPKDVREVPVQREQNPVLGGSDGENPIITDPGELLVPGERHVMATLAEDDADRIRHILIKLECRHGYAVIGTMRSRASSAAYANAAGIASFGSVG